MDNILSWNSDSDISAIAALIRQNAVILGSSDTVLGLLAVANQNAHFALDHVKQRNEKPYVILAGSNEQVFGMIGSFKTAQMEKIARRLMGLWPGPLTLVLPEKPNIASSEDTPSARPVQSNFSSDRATHPARPDVSTGLNMRSFERNETSRKFTPEAPRRIEGYVREYNRDLAADLNSTIAIRVPKHEGLLRLLKLTGPLFSTSANISGQPIPERLEDVDPSILNKVAAVINKDRAHYPVVPSTIVDCSGEEVRILREGVIPENAILDLTHS